MTAVLIEPGLVLLRGFVDNVKCQELANMACQWGENVDDGFYVENTHGAKVLNTGEQRGRIYDKADRFPPQVIDYSNRAVSAARAIDPCMPEMDCTHLLLNMYTTATGLPWHRDIYENDGKSDHPVVNLCVGATCKFGIKHSDNDQERVLTLRNGDILLFGGPCRLIKHAVLEVDLDDCPEWMADSPVRFSFTFRDAPEVLGREHEFKYFRVQEHLVGQETFEDPDLRACTKSFRGLPSVPSQGCVIDELSSAIDTMKRNANFSVDDETMQD
jgi:alkylated DNA repair dioxygenase AlkB